MTWLQLAMAVFGLAKEVFKYLREQEESNRVCAIKVKETTNVIKTARKTKDTSGLESAFAGLGFGATSKPPVKLQDS